ncbi:hypothetical protein [Actinoallomurus sp. NPDC050550]|uniref:hypothetical protein n=1 Tax=Actinoallomurus sp. NPDC050550 TaxID=3154937 RepID=UPI0033DB3A6D
MARYYKTRSPAWWVIGFLIAVIAVVFIGHVVYAWLIPLIPLVGAVLLVIALSWAGFRRRK